MDTNIKAIAAGKGINVEVNEDYQTNNPESDSQTPLSETEVSGSKNPTSLFSLQIKDLTDYIKQQNEQSKADEDAVNNVVSLINSIDSNNVTQKDIDKVNTAVGGLSDVQKDKLYKNSAWTKFLGYKNNLNNKQGSSSDGQNNPDNGELVFSETLPEVKEMSSDDFDSQPTSEDLDIPPAAKKEEEAQSQVPSGDEPPQGPDYDKMWDKIKNVSAPHGVKEEYLTMMQYLDKEHGAEALKWYFERWMEKNPGKTEGDFSEDLSQHWIGVKDWLWKNGEWINPPPYGTLKAIINSYRKFKKYDIIDFDHLSLSTKGTGSSIQHRQYNLASNISNEKPKALNVKKPIHKKYAQGGDIDYTGPAWVDGTKNKPEHIFNFEQMQTLRAHLLDGIDTTSRAVAGLSNIINSLPNVNTYNNISNNDSGVTIEHLEFHMEVQELSDNYSAREAAQATMDEIVRIARKSGMRSISRR